MIGWFSAAVIGTFRSSLFRCVVPSVVRCRTVLLLLCFLSVDRPCFRNFYSTIPVDVVRVKCYVNSLFDPACVSVRITINKLYFVPKWAVAGVVSVFRNGRGLGTGKSDVSLMFFDSILHRSSSLADVDFTAVTGDTSDHIVRQTRIFY